MSKIEVKTFDKIIQKTFLKTLKSMLKTSRIPERITKEPLKKLTNDIHACVEMSYEDNYLSRLPIKKQIIVVNDTVQLYTNNYFTNQHIPGIETIYASFHQQINNLTDYTTRNK
ncbi:MAG: hypothetical protein ABIB43_03380 [archaeon]